MDIRRHKLVYSEVQEAGILLNQKRETYKAGAVKLMAAAFIVRILGFVNRIYMSNILGAEGMGLFQLASPVYSLIILTLTSGVSISVSGMTAQERARGRNANALRVCKTAFVVLLVAGAVCGILLAVFGKTIAEEILNDGRAYYSLIMLAPCIPIVASASAIKGYFYGSSHVTPTALSQIAEQIVRIAVIFFVANRIAGSNLAYACAIATTSAAFGEMANLIVVGIAFRREKSKEAPTLTRKAAAKTILKYSMPISLNRLAISFMGMVETVLLPMRFIAGGLDYKSGIETLGRISGMAMPLIAFPTLITSSVATTLVPAISEAISVKNYKLANLRISRCLNMGFLLGFIFFGLYFSLGDFAGELLYPGQGVGVILAQLSYCCIFMYVEQIMAGIINGLGKQGLSLATSTVGYLITIGFIWFGVPQMGIRAYILGSILSMAATVFLNLCIVIKTTGLAVNLRDWILKPSVIAAGCILVGKVMLSIPIQNRFLSFFVCGCACCLTVLLLVATMFRNLKWGDLFWRKMQTRKS